MINAATRESLPEDLEEYVQEDNKRFAAEILSWDDQLTRKEGQLANKNVSTGENVLIGDDPECQIIESKSDLSNSHAALASESTMKVFRAESATQHDKKKTSNYNMVISKLYNNAKSKPKEEDNKLDSFLQYLVSVDAELDIVKRALFEQICLPTLDNSSEFARGIVAEANENLIKAPFAEETAMWHKAYHSFRYFSLDLMFSCPVGWLII